MEEIYCEVSSGLDGHIKYSGIQELDEGKLVLMLEDYNEAKNEMDDYLA